MRICTNFLMFTRITNRFLVAYLFLMSLWSNYSFSVLHFYPPLLFEFWRFNFLLFLFCLDLIIFWLFLQYLSLICFYFFFGIPCSCCMFLWSWNSILGAQTFVLFLACWDFLSYRPLHHVQLRKTYPYR